MSSIQLNAKDYPIRAVTVFSDKAEVVRGFHDVQLKTGHNEVVIVGLPDVLQQDSLRVEGSGESGSIADVNYQPAPQPPVSVRKEPSIVSLEHEKRSLVDQLGRLKSELGILHSYGASLTGEHIAPDKLISFLETYDKRAGELEDRISGVEAELQEVEEKERQERARLLKEKRQDRCGVKVTVVLHAKDDCTIEVRLTYLVSGSSWSPLYDLRAGASQNESHDFAVSYRAEIEQSAGEDWLDVQLTLSTASPTKGAVIPKLEGYRVGVPRGEGTQLRAAGLPSRVAAAGAEEGKTTRRLKEVTIEPESEDRVTEELAASVQNAAAPEPSALPHRGTSAKEGLISATFEIEGKSSIPADGAAHKVLVADLALDASFSWVAVPKQIERAFLQAKVTNTSDRPLLSGPAQVFLEGAYVGATTIRDVAPQETFTVALGIDPAIGVRYHPRVKRSTTSSPLSWVKSTSTFFSQQITVANTRAERSADPVIVRDQIPISQDSRIKIILRHPKVVEDRDTELEDGVVVRWARPDDEEAPSSAGGRTVGQELGLVEWVLRLKPGESKTVKLEWEVQSPVAEKWSKLLR